ncbi:hypothetical protein ACLB2K_032877 [Fragaria x ananassa]
MASGDRKESKCCFKEWMEAQERDLTELLQALTVEPENIEQLKQLAGKCITHFEDYIEKRNKLAHKDISAYFAPDWCSPWENSLVWIAGCRPSLFFRLIYALSGSEVESNLTKFLRGTKNGYLGEVMSSTQLVMVNALQSKTISEEERLTMRLAALQEDIADQPIAMIAKGLSKVGEMNEEVEKALDDHGQHMVKLLEEADELRMNTMKEVLKILTPLQGVDFLVASKKLHLCVHRWGRQRDQKHGRVESDEGD